MKDNDITLPVKVPLFYALNFITCTYEKMEIRPLDTMEKAPSFNQQKIPTL